MSDPTEPQPSPELSALLDALAGPPRDGELRGAADAVASMQSVIAPTGRTQGAPMHPTRTRTRIAMAATAGAIFVGGAAAAAGFDPADRPPSFDAPPVSVPPVSLPEQARGPASTTTSTTVAATTTTTTTTTASTTSTTTTTIPGATTTVMSGEVVCADGNHGRTVSSVAIETPPGADHGPAVVVAAQSECGMSVGDEGATAAGPPPVTPGAADERRPDDAGPPADVPGNTAPGRPDAAGPPADVPGVTAPGRPDTVGPPADGPATTAPGRGGPAGPPGPGG